LIEALKKLGHTRREPIPKKCRKLEASLSDVLGSIKSASEETYFGQGSDELVSPPLLQDPTSPVQGKQRASRSPTAEKATVRESKTSKTSQGLPSPSRSPIMGTQSSSANGAGSQDHEVSESGSQKLEAPESSSFPLTKECKHYTHISQVDWDIQK
jgi:hypothetical protein